jgi:hypothetical protein
MTTAMVAVARKLAIIMHRMWVSGLTFQHGSPTIAAAAQEFPRSMIGAAGGAG